MIPTNQPTQEQEISSLEYLQEKLSIIHQQHAMLDMLMFKRTKDPGFLDL